MWKKLWNNITQRMVEGAWQASLVWRRQKRGKRVMNGGNSDDVSCGGVLGR